MPLMVRNGAAGIVVAVAALAGGHAGAAGVEPATWDEVSAAYAAVRDYTCLYEKEERAISNGDRQRIRLSFRKPLDVRLEWLNESGKVDQIAVYRQGFNDGKLLGRRSGLLGSMIGTVQLEPTDRRAMEDSRHPIVDVGIGYIVDRLTRDVRSGVAAPPGQRAVTLDGAPSERFEFTALSQNPLLAIAGARTALVWVDPAHTLPVRVDVLAADGGMLERHRFRDLRINVGLTDTMFTL